MDASSMIAWTILITAVYLSVAWMHGAVGSYVPLSAWGTLVLYAIVAGGSK